ncbi:MAG: decarboxylating NADP(+)-dependent phosphogluconate dehydrogenase [Chlamydiia bacterium]|nr:decarboxylating NADP(+)-dependent phosphogluconate dehydrogenase [Chlamydiia bacterium]
MEQADIGLIGMAVMGQNLALNMNDNGFKVVVYNRTTSKVDDFMEGPAKGTEIIGTHSVEEFIKSLKRPRKIMLMVKAGKPVDAFIETLLPHLEPGDIIIDGGNSEYEDTTRRVRDLKAKGILYVGAGVSGGEEGARHGPSIMPGGNLDAWEHVKPILQAISAKVNGEPCCDWVGDEGAGHFVKMVHNGIEYGDMQLIAEAYNLLKESLGLSYEELSILFSAWNKTELDSYLIEITGHIFKTDDTDGQPLLEKIMDRAGQKGTGKWTAISSLQLGVPLTLIGEAVFARFLSAMKEERVHAADILGTEKTRFHGSKEQLIEGIRESLYASKIVSYAQGFMLMRKQGEESGWNFNYGKIALMWRGGCIIRSAFLGKIKEAYEKNPDLQNLLLDPFFAEEIKSRELGWRFAVSQAVLESVPLPCMGAALAFFDGYRSKRLPANLIQAQRDYFGAHTYERIDRPKGEFFHTNWTGTGGKVSSTTYNA